MFPYDIDGDGVEDGCGWQQVSAGGFHSCAIDSAGAIACWGSDYYGQVSGVPAGTFTDVSAGYEYTCAIDEEGSLHCWGSDFSGESSDMPSGAFVDVSGGACAIDADGQISWEEFSAAAHMYRNAFGYAEEPSSFGAGRSE